MKGLSVSKLLALAALAATPLALSACADRDEPVEATPTAAPAATAEVATITIGDLLENPTLYAGKTVTVAGEVNDVLGPKAFSIGGEEFLPPGELLIVSPTGFPAIPNRPENEYLVDDDLVIATGTVRNFVRVEVERDLGGPLEGEAWAEWEGKPVLVASKVVTTPRVTGVVDRTPGTVATPGVDTTPGAGTAR